MRALTLHQPFASLIAYGAPSAEPHDYGPSHRRKTIETRNWRGRMPTWLKGQRLAIHAGKTYDRAGAELVTATFYLALASVAMPRGAIVAVADVAGVALLEPSDCVAALFPGDPEPGRFGIWLTGILALPEPIPCRGVQGLWNVPPEIEEQLP